MAHTSLAANEWLRVPPEGKPAKHPFTTDWGHNKWRIFPRRYAEWLERKGHRISSASWVGTKRLWIWKTLAATGKKLLSCGSPRLEGASQIGSLPWPRSTSRQHHKVKESVFCLYLQCAAKVCADLQDFQAASGTPSSGNWVDEIAAKASHVQRTGE